MIPDVQVPSYDQAFGSLGNVYDPQVQSVQAQQAQLPGQQAAQMSALDQAKVNAFRDITTAANSKGMLFSGFSPDQQAQYVGTKYLPAVANLNTSFNNQKMSLTEKINAINAQRSQQAQGMVSSAQTAAQNAAYKNAQLQIASQRAATSSSNSAATKTAAASAAAGQINSYFATKTGKDGYLSPYDYNAGLSAWAQDGYSPSQFAAVFGKYMNPNQPKGQYK